MHSTHVPLATLHRRPPQSLSWMQATQIPRVESHVGAVAGQLAASAHSAMHVRDVGSHVNPLAQSDDVPQATQTWSAASHTGVPFPHCALAAQATHCPELTSQ